MKFVCYSEWDQLPESADTLFDQAEKDSLFFSRLWFESLNAEALEADHSIVLACVLDGDQVLAILPLMKCTGNEKAWYSLRHGFTPIYSLLLAHDKQEQVFSCLAEGFSQLPVKGLLLEPVADNDSKLVGLQRSLEAVGFNCDYSFRDYNWIYRLHGQSYAEYMADRPSHLRNTIARKQRKLEREHDYDIQLFTGEAVLDHIADYYVVYDASWKQNEINNAAFMDSIIERFSKAGWTRLAVLYVKGQPVAAQIWFVCHGKANIFRLAYDKGWRQYSPGSILTSFLMEHVIDADKVETIDFLTGNDAYKQDWMSERRERFLLGCIKREKPVSGYQRFLNTLRGKRNDKAGLKSRLIKYGIEAIIIILVFVAIKTYMQRDLVDGVAPPLEAVQLDGQAFNLHSNREQPILLHFWATWCGICKLEEGSIAAISEDHKVITVAMQSGDDQDIQDYLKERELNFPVIVDEYGEIAKRFGVRGVPTSFVVDPNGNIDFTEVGYTTSWGLRVRLWLAGE